MDNNGREVLIVADSVKHDIIIYWVQNEIWKQI